MSRTTRCPRNASVIDSSNECMAQVLPGRHLAQVHALVGGGGHHLGSVAHLHTTEAQQRPQAFSGSPSREWAGSASMRLACRPAHYQCMCANISEQQRRRTVILTVSKKAASLTPRPSFLAPAGHKRPTKQPAFTPCFVDSDSGCWPSSCRQCHTQQLVAAVRPPRCARQAQHRAIA